MTTVWRRRARPRDERGSASLELVGLLPVIIVFGAAAFQVGAILWATTSVEEAAREAARAYALGEDGCGTAEDALGGGIDLVSCSGGREVTLVAEIPMVLAARDLVPEVRITKTAEMPRGVR